MSSSNDTNPDSCENCSSNFTIFKRKKICNMCNQAFCQFCVNRSVRDESNTNQNSRSSGNERICVICQSVCSPQTNTDDLMKLKLKHLRSILNKANVPTNTCKDKRDLAELMVRNMDKFKIFYRPTPQTNNNQQQQQQQQPQQQNTNQQQQQQQQTNSSSTSSFNNTFNNFFNNVQDFVNFNLNSVLNNSVPCGPPPSRSTTTTTTTNSSNGSANNPDTNSNNNTNRNKNSRNTNASTSSSTSSTTGNLGSVFNFFGEQFPNVINQTFTNFTSSNNNPEQNDNRSTSQSQPNTSTTSSSATSTTTTTTNQPTSVPRSNSTTNLNRPPTDTSTANSNQSTTNHNSNFKRRASLSDLKSESDIDSLSIKQIKEILANNFVEYKGCCERKELLDKLKRLYNSHQENKLLEKEINSTSVLNDAPTEAEPSASSNSKSKTKANVDESDLCKICMESLIDCVLLDCGHMCSCIKCGKQLAECPMCRQNVVRVVRVFKS